jgi:hypothetical protein
MAGVHKFFESGDLSISTVYIIPNPLKIRRMRGEVFLFFAVFPGQFGAVKPACVAETNVFVVRTYLQSLLYQQLANAFPNTLNR